jgi:hypothetical protein
MGLNQYSPDSPVARPWPGDGTSLGGATGTLISPAPNPRSAASTAALAKPPAMPLSVALQVAFERQTLKPVFHLIGYRLWV